MNYLLGYKNVLTLLSSVLVTGLLLANVANAESAIEQDKLDDIVYQAMKATPNIENGKNLYRNCAVCHSPEGWGAPSGRYPQIAGQHNSVSIKQLRDIHDGNRDNPTMEPFTAPLFIQGAQSLADVSAYISQLPMVPNNSVGYGGTQLAEGKKLYDDNCKECHKANGEGNAEKFYPRIQGQHFSYLVRQLHWIKNGKRRNADKKMVKQLQKFSYRDIELMSDYISRLRPDKSIVAESMYWKNPDFRSGFYSAPRD
ncbi:MAG: c-type cytochrome [gamma proteobacterium symbiont of Taylorina sp.]|nr:c-type cytochrome [gamma proteobacterium symbiont of Taylorina sp.]